MKKGKKTQSKEPKPSNPENAPIVSEPEAIYMRAPRQDPAALRTIGIMGMQGRREFTEVKNEKDFIGLIRARIPKQVMNHLMEITDLTLAEMAAIMHTSDRNLRRYEANEKLSQEQSERMVELAKLYGRGEEVFGSISRFKEWMDTSLLPFGYSKPKEFLDTSLGIQIILDELGRIEHGVLA